ncbi:MAG TPA: adenylate/guanylate cyclase domain-containing protein [Casimicrobiaceae bacterium]|nr:adenylate/guanylate cyclase domain-containing protein [Casimicrobiaceae bacterium]
MDRRGAGILTPGVGEIRAHLERGAPWDACDVVREQIAAHPGDAELLYCGALAHARAGATRRARALLDEAQARLAEADAERIGARSRTDGAATPSPSLLVDVLSLRGRLWKDALGRALQGATVDGADLRARDLAARARDEYLAAYALAQDPYPGINAATLSMLVGDRARARSLAQEIAARLSARAAALDCWGHATLGEAALLLGEFDRAVQSYAAARALCPGDAGNVATMRRQVLLLQHLIPEARDVLRVLPVPDVLVFAGHMVDVPDRPEPRFPATLAPAVDAAIRARLARLHQPIVYASAACGADLIFVEAALDAGAEVNVVLPFDRDDFLRTSVAIGGRDWVDRYDHALARASRVIMATEENHLGDDVLFEYAATLLEGLALLRAAQLETSPSMLCVLDPAAAVKVGGTRASFERWRRNVGPPRVIDLRELRQAAATAGAAPAPGSQPGAAPPAGIHASVPPQASSEPRLVPGPIADATPPMAGRPQRTLKSLLFADFAGYSRLHDACAPLFQQRFLEIGARLLGSLEAKPLEAKTWGDALYVVFEAPRDAAEFALQFLASMLDADWAEAGLPEGSQIRVALHDGPVFRIVDPVVARDSYFGSSVTRAARIEPVTPPGMIYVSEAFAATLAAGGERGYALEYVGRLPLAKGYGESRIYRLDRR